MRFILFLFLSAGFKGPVTFAQPKGIHLSWNGARKVNTSGTMAVTWLNDIQGSAVVEYGKDIGRLDKRATADVKYADALKAFVSKATLKKLDAETNYYYRVGSEASGWSPVYTFRTASKTGDTKKILVGIWSDTQNNGGNYNFEQTDSVVKAMSKHAYYFTIHNGDIVENGSVVKSWKDLFNVTELINANHPFMSVTGNHDVVNDTASVNFQKPFPVYYDLFNLPGNQLNYSYDYGNSHFIAINSGYAQAAEKAGKVLFGKGSEEYRWLEKDLAKARKNRKTKWIILYSHYPLYSYGFSHIPTWQKHVKPLVDKYAVDVYLAGHRHVYERHKSIRGTDIFEPDDMHTYTNPKGTVYITNGSCGGALTGTGGHNLPTMIFTPKEKMYTYAMMSIEGNTLAYTVYNKSGIRIDHFTIRK